MRRKRNPHPGIRARHRRGCPGHDDDTCSCKPAWEAWVFSKRDDKKIRRTFPTLAAAKLWRAEAKVSLSRGSLRAPTRTTLHQAADSWLDLAGHGIVRTRSGGTYKPSTLRGYEQGLRLHALPDIGGARLTEISSTDLQDLADRLLAGGLDPSTIRNAFMPLRAIYRRATARGDVAVNPTTGLELPVARGRRERIASPAEAVALLAVLPESDRAIWATAFYAGLRLGELRALEWKNVDLDQCVIQIERAWDPKVGLIEPKSRAGRRTVPIPRILRTQLVEHRLRSGRASGLAFGREAERPFQPSSLTARARRAWATAGLNPIGFHEARHTYASLMIAAGVNPKALSTYMGHSGIVITLDRYGHLLPGNEGDAANLLDAFLTRAGQE